MYSQSDTSQTSVLPPAAFKVLKWMQRRGLPGAYRLARGIRSHGWFDHCRIPLDLGGGIRIDVPIGMRNMDQQDADTYEGACLDYIAARLRQDGLPVTLVDCGADIGLVSAKLLAAYSGIHRIIAFEPNTQVFPHLTHNLALWSVQTKGYNTAVSDYQGRASLCLPAHDHSSHAAFIQQDQSGTVEVMRVDDLNLESGDSLLLKLDVEGEELAVLRGAVRTLQNSPRFLILFEAHPKQCQRSGIDPTEIIHFIQNIRGCSARVTEMPEQEISLDVPFFSQFSPERVYNILVWDHGED